MPKTEHFPLGTSEPFDDEIRDNGDAKDCTGFTLALQIERRDGASIATPPSVAFISAPAGTVRVSGLNNLAAGSYFVRYKLTDSGGKIGFSPNGKDPDIWQVVDP